MRIKTAAGAAILGLFLGISGASAVQIPGEVPQNQPKTEFEMEYGKALPPIGFVQFCVRSPDDCKATGGNPDRLAMTPERWNLLYQVNTYVNGKIAPVSDQDLYGQPEYWTYPSDAGDCEDYLLLKRRYLLGLGFPPDALLITVVLDEKQEGHAVLTVTTANGDYILDNRHNEVLRWSDFNYTFLKRQSPRDPRVWMALENGKTHNSGFVTGGSTK
jgi:predicted transglutaminase-like cysteine proteinase